MFVINFFKNLKEIEVNSKKKTKIPDRKRKSFGVSTPKIFENSYNSFKVKLLSTISGLVSKNINGIIEATPDISNKAIIIVMPIKK